MASKNEVLEYEAATVTIFFEKDHVACQYCPLLETYARKQCRRTGEYIVDDRVVGGWCPLRDPETGCIEGQYY